MSDRDLLYFRCAGPPDPRSSIVCVSVKDGQDRYHDITDAQALLIVKTLVDILWARKNP